MTLAPVERLNIGISAGAVAASMALGSPWFTTSLAAGAILEAVNLGAIYRGAQELFRGEVQSGSAWVGLFAMRFTLLGVAIFIVMQAGAHPIALLIGLSLAMPAVVIDAWRSRPPVLDASQLPTVPPDDPSWDRWSAWRVREMDQPLDDEHFILDAAVDANATDTPEDLSPDDLAKEDA